MNDRMNQLAAWMKFYDDNKIGGAPQGIHGWNGAAEDANYGGGRALWAQGMLNDQGGQPGFFSNLPTNQLAPYTQPQQFNEAMPQRKPMNDPMGGQTMNYLAALMGKR